MLNKIIGHAALATSLVSRTNRVCRNARHIRGINLDFLLPLIGRGASSNYRKLKDREMLRSEAYPQLPPLPKLPAKEMAGPTPWSNWAIPGGLQCFSGMQMKRSLESSRGQLTNLTLVRLKGEVSDTSEVQH